MKVGEGKGGAVQILMGRVEEQITEEGDCRKLGDGGSPLLRVVYVVQWNAPYTRVTCTEYPPNSELVFLPDWYIQRLHPPRD